MDFTRRITICVHIKVISMVMIYNFSVFYDGKTLRIIEVLSSGKYDIVIYLCNECNAVVKGDQ